LSFTTIFKGVLPFVATDLVRLVVLSAFPAIALYLPGRIP
jgi:C4-dicarboxylate transporter, DctM subunit